MKATARCLAAVCLLFSSVESGIAQYESLADISEFRKGCQSFSEGNYEDAVLKLSHAWETVSADEENEEEKRIVASRLIQALYRADQKSKLVEWYDENKGLNISPEAKLFLAIALRDEEHFEAAAALFGSLSRFSTGIDISIPENQAYCLVRSGRPAAGLRLLEERGAADSPRKKFLRAVLAQKSGDYEQTIAYADSLLDGDEEPKEGSTLHFEARLIRAKALTKLGKGQEAASDLIALIEELNTPPDIYRAFEALKDITAITELSNLQEELDELRETQESPDVKLAAEYYGTVLSHSNEEELVEKLENFARQHANHPLGQEARITLSQLKPEESGYWLAEVEKSGAGEFLQARVDHARAAGLFEQDSFNEASKNFVKMAEVTSGEKREAPLYNAAIAALFGDDEDAFETLRKRIVSENQASPVHADLLFLSGIFFASKNDPRAFELLSGFVRDYPDHPSNIEAELAMAELRLNQVPPRPQSARKILSGLTTRRLGIQENERLDYTSLWIEVIDQQSTEVERVGEKFLQDWPNSVYRAEVSMLVASHYFEQGKFKRARELFEIVATDFPNGDFAEAALFFAAKSNPGDSGNLKLWDELIAIEGDLARAARHEKGLLLLSLNRFDEAREQFATVENAEFGDSELKIAAMAERGYSWFMEALRNDGDKEMLGNAADIFGRVSRMPNASRAWRYESAVRRGKALEAQGNSVVALEIYRSLIRETEDPSLLLNADSPIRETEWLYRAGFAAIAILESNEDWAGTIKMADTLSRKNGPRAIEAARYADRMRLKHWVWE